MTWLLTLHPHSHCSAVAHIEGEVAPRSDSLVFSYTVTGNMRDIATPQVQTPAREDKLWQHTCFEAFLRAAGGDNYYELNFASSARWGAYHFTGYRTGMREAAEISAIPIEVQSTSESLTLQASVKLDHLSGLSRDRPWRLGLSAVIEERSGRKSYWALAHPPGNPDFHHPAGFVHELSPSAQR
jgi:hypothetical protein